MKIYFVTQKPMGEMIDLQPTIPKSGNKHEGEIPRICVSTSILGVLSSISPNLYLRNYTYIYTADVNINNLYQPIEEVSDNDMTGELWVLKPTTFFLHKVIVLDQAYDTFEVSPCLEKQKDQYPVIIGSFKFHDIRRGEIW